MAQDEHWVQDSVSILDNLLLNALRPFSGSRKPSKPQAALRNVDR